MENQIEIQQLLELDVQTLQTLEQCENSLTQLSDAQDNCARTSVSAGKYAILYGIKCGFVCLRAKEIAPDGQFGDWLEAQSQRIGRGLTTLRYWMKCAWQVSINKLDIANPTIKSMLDMYEAAGIVPERERKQSGSEIEDKPKLPWSPLKFSTRVEQWTKEQAMDFIYEFDRAAQFVRALKVQFGL